MQTVTDDRVERRVTIPARHVGATAVIAALAVLILLPVGFLVFQSLTPDGNPGFGNFVRVASDATYLQAAATSLALGLSVAVASVLIAAPLAFGVTRTTMKFKRLVNITVVFSIICPDFLTAMGYIILAGPNAGYLNQILRATGVWEGTGPLNIYSLAGGLAIALPTSVAFVYLILVPAIKNMNPSLEEASRLSGASGLTSLRTVTVPLMRPALLSGMLVTFAVALSMYGTPQMLNLNVVTVQIRRSVILGLDFDTAATLSIVLTIMSGVALYAYRRSTAMALKYGTIGGKSFSPRTHHLGWAQYVLSFMAVVYALAAFVVPTSMLLSVSFMSSLGLGFQPGNWTLDNYRDLLGRQQVIDAMANSLRLAALTSVIVICLGFIISYILVRTRSRLRGPLDYTSILALGIPGTAFGLAVMVVYVNPPLSGLGLYGSSTVLLLAYIPLLLAFGVRSTQGPLLQLSPELEEAARLAGSNEVGAVLRITVPVLKQSLAYGAILVFILTIPELSASILLSGPRAPVISTQILNIWGGAGGYTVAAAFGVILTIALSLLVFIAFKVTGRTRAELNLKL